MAEIYGIYANPPLGSGGGKFTLLFATEEAREAWLAPMADGWHKNYLRKNFRTLRLGSDGKFYDTWTDDDD